MKNLITTGLALLFPLIMYSQVSIEQFRKLEEKLNGLVVENQQLKDRVKSLEAGQINLGNKVDRESRSNRSKNSSTKQEVESQIASQQSSVNAQITSFDTKLTQIEADLIYSVDRRIDVAESRLDTLISQTQSDVLSSIRDSKRNVDRYERRVKSALSQLDNSLPVGSIVSYHLNPSNLPDNWVLCHGQEINDSASIYNGYKVPNLKGYFIRGKNDSEDNGDKGGKDYTSSHSHSIPSHRHEVGNHTHDFTTDRSRASFYYKTIYYTRLDGEIRAGGDFTWKNRTQKISYFDTNTDNDGYHKHSGTTGNASKDYTDYSGGDTSGSAGGHSNVPEYKAFNYIIKIK